MCLFVVCVIEGVIPQSAGCPPVACSVLLTNSSVCGWVCVCVAVACSPVSCEIASFVTNYTIDPRVNLTPRHIHTLTNQSHSRGGSGLNELMDHWPQLPLPIQSHIHTQT